MKGSLLVGFSIGVLITSLIFATNTKAVSSVFAVIACATTTPCSGGNNTGTGAGVEGQSKSNHGVIGNTLFNSTGPSNGESAVFGQDLSTSGTYDMGVQGTSVRGYGVRGRSVSLDGVRGDSTTGAGVEGFSEFTGVYGASSGSSGYGVLGDGNAVGVYGISNTYGLFGSGQYGVDASGTAAGVNGFSTGGYGVLGQSQNNAAVEATSSYLGVEASGNTYGAILRSIELPLLLVGSAGATVFYVNAGGNVYYAGTLNHLASPRGVTTVTSDTQATSPALEETGTAHLVMGTANVYLTPSFSRSINSRYGYQVFLTPGGDTRGLYVAAKYVGGFIVREVQGGRGSFNFDYHVYAQTAAASETTVVPSVPAMRSQPFPKPPPIPRG